MRSAGTGLEFEVSTFNVQYARVCLRICRGMGVLTVTVVQPESVPSQSVDKSAARILL